MGCTFIATGGTADFLNENGIKAKVAKKIGEGVPNVLDVIRSGVCDLIIDIPKKGNDKGSDGFKIRRCASECSITLMTSLDTVGALVSVMEKKMTPDDVEVVSVKEIK